MILNINEYKREAENIRIIVGNFKISWGHENWCVNFVVLHYCDLHPKYSLQSTDHGS